ncbi:MAG: PHP domain-containing protein [Actinomycetota bacterium]
MIDLHVHSTASDGSDPPAEVVQKAAEAGITSIALTDHDTQAGIAEALLAAHEYGVELIPGTEISAEWEPGAMHLTVLFLAPGPGPLQDRLSELRKGRQARNSRIIERLGRLGIEMTEDELANESSGDSVGRPHIAAVMMRAGHVESIAEAFDRYLGRGRPGYEPRPRLLPEEAVGLAVESRAVPILAHPHTLGLDRSAEVAATLNRLRDAGLAGMECYYPLYSPLEREGYAALAERFGLVPAGGSDYHGSYKPEIQLGIGRGDLEVPEVLLDRLRPS